MQFNALFPDDFALAKTFYAGPLLPVPFVAAWACPLHSVGNCKEVGATELFCPIFSDFDKIFFLGLNPEGNIKRLFDGFCLVSLFNVRSCFVWSNRFMKICNTVKRITT